MSPRTRTHIQTLVAVALGTALGCGNSAGAGNNGGETAGTPFPGVPRAWIAPEPAQQEKLREEERHACEDRLAAALDGPELPGAPDLEARRAQVLLYAKAEPVLFVRT